jgi:putative ABC transport system ATP-binding protein
MIQATGITKVYTKGTIETHVLRGVAIDIQKGEFVAIMGKSGAGKSTLLYQLSLLDHATSGEVYFFGQPTSGLTEMERTNFRLAHIGYIFQDYALIAELTAVENVCLPLIMKGMSDAEAGVVARSMLDKVGLSGKYYNVPSELSGGEQQRVSIARAIAGSPHCVFADEPTANLDSASSQGVLELLLALKAEGLTIVMVTHEHEYAVLADRIVYLQDGLLVREERPKVY